MWVPRLALFVVPCSFLVWVVLSTSVPQLAQRAAMTHVSETIRDSTVYFVIGHPDDEVMFFAPSLIELLKPQHRNIVKIVCFSHGNAASLGATRKRELFDSARILGVARENVAILDFRDGMNETWPAEEVESSLRRLVTPSLKNVLVTFDEKGVSGHPNHVSLFHGTRLFKEKTSTAMYTLKSLPFFEKYSFTLLTNVELLLQHLSRFVLRKLRINVTVGEQSQCLFYADLNMLSLAYAAMAYGHFSQMVWFRYGWLVFSRYLTYNCLTLQ